MEEARLVELVRTAVRDEVRVSVREEVKQVVHDEVRQIVREEIQPLKQELQEIKRDVALLKTEIHELKRDVQVLKQDVQMLKQDVQVLKEKVELLENKLDRLSSDVDVGFGRMFHHMDHRFHEWRQDFQKTKEMLGNHILETRGAEKQFTSYHMQHQAAINQLLVKTSAHAEEIEQIKRRLH